MLINSVIRILRKLKFLINKNSLPGGLRLWITILSLAFVGYALSLNNEKLSELSLAEASLWWLGFGLLISLISLLINAFAWKSLLYWLGYSSREVDLVSLFLSSNLLKYLPGGIWHFVERLRSLKIYMSAGKALASVLLEPLLMASAAMLWVPFGGFKTGLELLCILPAFCFFRPLREPLLGRLKKLKANQLERLSLETRFTGNIDKFGIGRSPYPIKAFATEMLFILFRFGGFWCCVNAFHIGSTISFLEWLASFSLAWTIGLVVPAAPGGVGVFEAGLLISVAPSVPEAPLLASLLCYRLIATLADVLAAFFVSIKGQMMFSILTK